MKRFEHDCSTCQFLGQVGEFDMYWCARCDGGSIIARYGDGGPEYASNPLFVWSPERCRRLMEPDFEADRTGLAFVWALRQEPVKTAYEKMLKEKAA